MDKISSEEIQDIMSKYTQKIDNELGGDDSYNPIGKGPVQTREFSEFKDEYLPKHMNFYENACRIAEGLLSIKPEEKKEKEYIESIDICHLDVTPSGVVSFAILGPLAFMLIGVFITILIPIFLGKEIQMFFALFFVITALIVMFPLNNLPHFLANTWRLKASNEMVLCIFYVVTYMRHTSNLEDAINFAAEHLDPPLALDLRKVLWNVETEKYENIKESLEAYLATWKKWNMEFIEAFHLVESSLYETSEERRIGLLEKSLEVILEETYEKMLHYAHNLQSPVMMLNMLGVVLPILGLVILPLVVAFMDGVKWYHLAMMYNVILPLSLFLLTKNILTKRPTGYGDSDISETNPELKKYKFIRFKLFGKEYLMSPAYIAGIIGVVCLFISLIPLLMNLTNCNIDYGLPGGLLVDDTPECDGLMRDGVSYYFLGYREDLNNPGVVAGPFGLGATLLSLLFPIAFGVSFGLYFKLKTKNVIELRKKSKELENEFASALFQLGNRLGDGIPPEIAFSRVSEVMEGTISGDFFKAVSINISKLGMSVDDAIFNPRVGALVYFPSNIIESSMKVLVESSKKGPLIASQAILNVSQYIKQIHKVDERLKDLMADMIASLKSQINFLSPTISGVVIGITSMITSILGKLTYQMSQMQEKSATGGMGFAGGLSDMFKAGIPTYFFQIIVGTYVVQLVFILTILVNGIENGSDKLGERYSLGANMVRATILYTVISFVVIFAFNMISGTILEGAITG